MGGVQFASQDTCRLPMYSPKGHVLCCCTSAVWCVPPPPRPPFPLSDPLLLGLQFVRESLPGILREKASRVDALRAGIGKVGSRTAHYLC